ncbi:MAG: serine hydrolase domain-containing protein [Pseudomonadota bacterium]
MRRFFSALFLIALAAGCAMSGAKPVFVSDAADAGQTKRSMWEERVGALAGEHDFDGVVLIALGDEKVFERGYGDANRSWKIPNTLETKFRIASLSKTFTAVLVLQLVDEGVLSFDDTLATMLPAYRADYAGEVTLHHLLAHTSGISHYIDLPGWFDGAYLQPRTVDAFLSDIAALPLNAQPGEKYRYSNANYYFLGLIIERVTGKSFETVLSERILKPLSLNDTGHFTNSAIVASLAQNYIRTDDGAFTRAGATNDALFTATGSLYSTAEDLFLWRRGLWASDLLSNAERSIMFDRAAPIAWTFERRDLNDSGVSSSIWSYNGEIDGYTSMIMFTEEANHLVVLLNNNNAGFNALRSMSLDILKSAMNDMAL